MKTSLPLKRALFWSFVLISVVSFLSLYNFSYREGMEKKNNDDEIKDSSEKKDPIGKKDIEKAPVKTQAPVKIDGFASEESKKKDEEDDDESEPSQLNPVSDTDPTETFIPSQSGGKSSNWATF